ncbi:Lariat debranching enzyme [Ananas comosus]|uniref:Lariat debranching enzyme n=1 Tax=Ananas comosus TaxID=4615 RepID=A0A199VZQ7_ANACO|nr:Lariat debranching enzyme [Ananas comosus]
MKIAVEGCMHGELDAVYATLKRLEQVENTKIDLLLCCGDFQAVRNENDLESLNVKPKYRSMNTFWKYYSGQEVAPYPTIFIGGNHEASNYLWELYYGGWAAQNIYFLGYAGVVKFGNIRIGGLSGIYKPGHYFLGNGMIGRTFVRHFERPPYNDNDIRSIYHVRHYDVLKLMHVEEPIDIFLSHDWPLGITEYGNWEKLIKSKRHFTEEVYSRTLGSKPAAELLNKLRPPFWFSAHLHCKFPAVIQHGKDGPITKFLALDKCLHGRRFLQIIDIESDPGPYEIQYDEEWLAITKKVKQLDIQDCRQWVMRKLDERGAKPFDFVQTVPAYDPSQTFSNPFRTGHCRNPQTESLLQFLELPYLLDGENVANTPSQSTKQLNPTDALDDDDDVDELEEHADSDDEE